MSNRDMYWKGLENIANLKELLFHFKACGMSPPEHYEADALESSKQFLTGDRS